MSRRKSKATGAVGIGGVFFKARDPRKLSKWYQTNLGLQITENTALFAWQNPRKPGRKGYTVWALFPARSDYFHDPRKQFMINYRVKNLKQPLQRLRPKRVKIAKKTEESQYGKFAWVSDPEGNWLELWEPPRKYGAPEQAMPME